MAAFQVLHDFKIPPDAAVKMLAPGAVYIAGDVINGLSALEAGELLLLAPEGTFEPMDAEGDTVSAWAATKRVSLGGSVSAKGHLKAKGE